MSKGKRQSIIIIGFGLIVLSGIFLYYALSMPKVSISTSTEITYRQSNISESHRITSSKQTANRITENNEADYSYAGSDTYVTYPLNLNTCTAQELMTINGIGEKKASDIIAYRDYLGGYTSVEQIKNIKGIGDGIYAKISPYLTV